MTVAEKIIVSDSQFAGSPVPLRIRSCRTGRVTTHPAPSDGWTFDALSGVEVGYEWWYASLGDLVVADSEM